MLLVGAIFPVPGHDGVDSEHYFESDTELTD